MHYKNSPNAEVVSSNLGVGIFFFLEPILQYLSSSTYPLVPILQYLSSNTYPPMPILHLIF
jgi:hypothetical protein